MIEIKSVELSKSEYDELIYKYKLHTVLNKWPSLFKILDLEKLLFVFKNILLNQNEIKLFEKGLRVAILVLEGCEFYKYSNSDKQLFFISCCFSYLDKNFFINLNNELTKLQSHKRKYHYDEHRLETIKKYIRFIKLGTFKKLDTNEKKLISDACKLANIFYVDQAIEINADFICMNSLLTNNISDLKRKVFYKLETQEYKTRWADCKRLYNPISNILCQIKMGVENRIN